MDKEKTEEKALIKVVSAHALEPGKFYILNINGANNFPRERFNEMLKNVQRYLKANDINALFTVEPVTIEAITEITKADYDVRIKDIKHE